jgi:hypothetical protein
MRKDYHIDGKNPGKFTQIFSIIRLERKLSKTLKNIYHCCQTVLITIHTTANVVTLPQTQSAPMNEENDKGPRQKAPHILNASSNLLGICFVVLTSLKVLKVAKATIIDEVAAVDIVAFTASCLLSFLSLRNNNRKSYRLEQIADFIFIAGIGLLLVTAVLFGLDIIN